MADFWGIILKFPRTTSALLHLYRSLPYAQITPLCSLPSPPPLPSYSALESSPLLHPHIPLCSTPTDHTIPAGWHPWYPHAAKRMDRPRSLPLFGLHSPCVGDVQLLTIASNVWPSQLMAGIFLFCCCFVVFVHLSPLPLFLFFWAHFLFKPLPLHSKKRQKLTEKLLFKLLYLLPFWWSNCHGYACQKWSAGQVTFKHTFYIPVTFLQHSLKLELHKELVNTFFQFKHTKMAPCYQRFDFMHISQATMHTAAVTLSPSPQQPNNTAQ